MTSVVDTSVKHFHNGMVGAPVLNGQIGSLIALLDACLVNGFDLKSATSLVVAGGVATLAFSGTHSATVDSVVLVAGSSIAALNGEQKVTAIGNGFVKFATAAIDAASTGTITFKMAPVGWLKPFAGTNLAVYKSADPAGTGMYLRVDDTTTYQAKVVGYEGMTDINTGVGPFPTPAMSATGGYWAKSWVANTTAVPWTLIADGRVFYISIAGNYATNALFVGHIARGFGDMGARRPGGDPYACVLNCHIDATVIPAVSAMTGGFSSGGTPNKLFMPRNHTGLGSAIAQTCYSFIGSTTSPSGMDTRFGPFPGPFGEVMLSKKHIGTDAYSFLRADVPGLYHIVNSAMFDTFKTGDKVAGTGNLSGRSLFMLAVTESVSATASNQVGILAFDITGPWR